MEPQHTSNRGILSGWFGGQTAVAPAQEQQEQRLSIAINVTGEDLSPESIVTGNNFVLANDVFTGAVEVTPQIAQVWLERNNNVRGIQPTKVNLFKQCMASDKWDFNGETIKFNMNGELVDGQNRLKACVDAGKPFKTHVVFGIESALNVDRGKPRSTGQIIQKLQITYDARIAAAMSNFLYVYRITEGRSFARPGLEARQFTLDEAVQFIQENHEELNYSMSKTYKVKTLFNKPSLHAALHYLFKKSAGAEEADRFYSNLTTGAGLELSNPVYALREKLLKERSAKHQPNINPYAGLIIKGWNNFLSGKSLSMFRYRYDAEGMPQIMSK